MRGAERWTGGPFDNKAAGDTAVPESESSQMR
jgi:hypothetical protein